MSSTGDDATRLRTLSEKGKEQYEANRDSYLARYVPARDNLDLLLEKSDTVSTPTQALSLQRELETSFATFSAEAEKLKNFLVRGNNKCSVEDLDHHSQMIDLRVSKYNGVMTNLASLSEQRSVSSSSQSRVSQTSSIAARKRAKAEASKTRAAFARKELELKKQQALLTEQKRMEAAKLERQEKDLAAELAVLVEEKEAAAADAEAAALEDVEDGMSRSQLPLPILDAKARTAEFVAQQSNLSPDATPFTAGRAGIQVERADENDGRELRLQLGVQGQNEPVAWSETLSTMLLRKELLSSRLSTFNERPENFDAWREGFKSVTRELKATPREELDLLTTHLGAESAKYAQSLRASNSSNPARGLALLWERLEDRYGSAEVIEAHLKAKVDSFPTVTAKDPRRLFDLCDLLDEIGSAKANPKLAPLFASYDSSTGVNAIMRKLPHHLRQRWVTRAAKYKEENNVLFPPFTFLAGFLRKESKLANDPAFNFQDTVKSPHTHGLPKVVARQTVVHDEQKPRCPIHKSNHALSACKAFLKKRHEEKVTLLKEKKLCFKCLDSTSHIARNCPAPPKCQRCQKSHHTAMHREEMALPVQHSPQDHGGESSEHVEVSCTKVCGGQKAGRSCGKIMLVSVSSTQGREKLVYAILDDQSNRTLASTSLFDALEVSSEEKSYQLSSCAGTLMTSGRTALGLRVQSASGGPVFSLPNVLECNGIPQDTSEIPTPEIADAHPHLRRLAKKIPPFNSSANISLLIGRDVPGAHHVLEQVVGPPSSPFAQRLPLGWAVIGEVCLDGAHKPSTVTVNKTFVAPGRRETILEPCYNRLKVKELEHLGADVFERTKDDEKPGPSIEDRRFISLMDASFKKKDGRWSAPLPFKEPDVSPPDNYTLALSRARLLHKSMEKNPKKREDMVMFMAKVLETGAAERAPPIEEGKSRWYLPLFGVYHPRKPEKIRGVFDSSAAFQGCSLNSMLLSGPDLTNSLVGILLRFRRDSCPVTADIEQMFYRFYVDEQHRDFLRFLWYEDNDPEKDLVEYRMTVHVFGNSPSPAVATYGLRKTAAGCEQDVVDFVSEDFYVDDGVTSTPNAAEAVSLVERTKTTLMEKGKLRLHKIASTDREVLKAFNKDELCEVLKQVNLDDLSSPLPLHSCLGLPWDLEKDTFAMEPTLEDTAFTRRGLLSMLNGIYDPLGFLSPAVIAGKILLRKITANGEVWDQPLPESFLPEWLRWRASVESLGRVDVPRMFISTSLSESSRINLHIFCDASEQAIAAVSYIEQKSDDELKWDIGFVMGKAKVAPTSGHTVPRLELCSAVLAVELFQTISEHLSAKFQNAIFHTDSRVVLGYINNETRRFHTYVTNRVAKIRSTTKPEQWKYIPTELNPADAATRGNLEGLQEKVKRWLQPMHDAFDTVVETSPSQTYPLICPNDDKEIRVSTLKTEAKEAVSPLTARFERFSSWTSLVRAFRLLRRVGRSFHSSSNTGKGTTESLRDTEIFVLATVQQEAYAEEIKSLRDGRPLLKSSTLHSLSPYLDGDGLLRVGGRLGKAEQTLGVEVVHPAILPKRHHVSTLLARHFHGKVKHQGRHFTEGALRTGGFWIIGAKRLVSSLIHDCLVCKRLRGIMMQQKMADLPTDRVVPSAPFSHVGVDVFGPWEVITRRTRGGAANSKRWAVVFTCLAVRAIHIEVIEEMSSSSFINALTRFTSLRGPVTEFRSDRGTNFTGAVSELNLETLGVVWKFNPPAASHMGGVWERMIGVIRRILDSMLLNSRRGPLSHEVLCTLMAEVCAIVNGRPIVPISHDPDSPLLLTPSMLLTQKTGSGPASQISLNLRDMYTAQWKHVQVLSNIFWKRWNEEYLHNLQHRRKWETEQNDVKQGDLVLLRDKGSHRNDWPIGLVTKTFPSQDGLTRSAQIRVVREGTSSEYVRPVTELVLLESE